MNGENPCGTCKWFEAITTNGIGFCSVMDPLSVKHKGRKLMSRDEGDGCPCHAPKEPAK